MSAQPGETAGWPAWRARLQHARSAPTPYHALNPFTRVVIGLCGVAAAILAPTVIGVALTLTCVALLATLARTIRRLWRPGVTAAVPIALGAAAFALAEGHTLPAALEVALDGGLRGAVIVMSLGLFWLTADLPTLGLDLERRGLDHRYAFGIIALLGAGPGIAERFRTISAAQQARGLQLGRGPLQRVRAAAPIWLPALVSTLGRLTDRSLALEARAIGRPGRRDLLWAPADPARERVLRLALVAAVVLAVTAHLVGVVR
ncbi:MAG: energy-coupling factor transporter transmembrane component T [Candidatus Limnocylindrales bacterium]